MPLNVPTPAEMAKPSEDEEKTLQGMIDNVFLFLNYSESSVEPSYVDAAVIVGMALTSASGQRYLSLLIRVLKEAGWKVVKAQRNERTVLYVGTDNQVFPRQEA